MRKLKQFKNLPKRYRLYGVLLAFVGVLTTCATPPPQPAPPAPPAPVKAKIKPIARPKQPPPQIQVKHLDVVLRESFPLLAKVIIRGEFTNSCIELDDVLMEYSNNEFKLYLKISKAKRKDCKTDLISFEESIPLPMENMESGVYKVHVDNKSVIFELEVDNNTGFIPGM